MRTTASAMRNVAPRVVSEPLSNCCCSQWSCTRARSVSSSASTPAAAACHSELNFDSGISYGPLDFSTIHDKSDFWPVSSHIVFAKLSDSAHKLVSTGASIAYGDHGCAW